MKTFQVGEFYEELKRSSEGVIFDMFQSGAVLFIAFNRPDAKEVDSVQNGDIEYKFYYYKNVIWMLFKFGNMPWVDSPFSIHLSTSMGFELPGSGEGLGCTIMMSDCTTGELKAMRFISFSEEFSRQLSLAIEEQLETEFSIAAHDRAVNETMQMFTTKQLVQKAKIRGKIKR